MNSSQNSAPSGREPPFIEYSVFQNRYKVVRKVEDGYLGRIHLYRDMKAKQSFWVKEISFASKGQFMMDLDTFIKNPVGGHSCFVQAIGFTYKSVYSKETRGESFIAYYMYEYIEDTFEKVMAQKVKEKSYFHCEEVINLFNHVAIACSFLQKNYCFHGDLRPGNIYVTRENAYKLFYVHFKTSAYEQLKAVKTDSNNLIKKKYFISPEVMYLFSNFHKNSNTQFVANLFENINFVRSDVYSLGMIGLICLNYYDFSSIYDWVELKLNFTKINTKLHETGRFHNDLLSSCLWKMLAFSAENRLDFVELELELSGNDSLGASNNGGVVNPGKGTSNQPFGTMKFTDGCDDLEGFQLAKKKEESSLGASAGNTSLLGGGTSNKGNREENQNEMESPKFLVHQQMGTPEKTNRPNRFEPSNEEKAYPLSPPKRKVTPNSNNSIQSENYGKLTMNPGTDLQEDNSSVFVKKKSAKKLSKGKEDSLLDASSGQASQFQDSLEQKNSKGIYSSPPRVKAPYSEDYPNLSEALESHNKKRTGSPEKGFSQLLDSPETSKMPNINSGMAQSIITQFVMENGCKGDRLDGEKRIDD